MALVSRWQPLGELSPRAFDAEVRSLVQRAALEELARRITTTGPIAVRHTRYTPISGRVCFELSDDSTLKLRLFWRRRGQVDRLDSIRFDDRIGWIVVAQSGGSRLVFYAWLATYQTACFARTSPRRQSREPR